MKAQENTTTATATAYKVSEQTAAIIDCLKEANKLYSHIHDALEPLQGNAADKLLQDRLAPSFAAIASFLEEQIGHSVGDKQSINGSKEI